MCLTRAPDPARLGVSELTWPCYSHPFAQLCCPATQKGVWEIAQAEALDQAVREGLQLVHVPLAAEVSSGYEFLQPFHLQAQEPQLAGLLHSSIISHKSLGDAMARLVHCRAVPQIRSALTRVSAIISSGVRTGEQALERGAFVASHPVCHLIAQQTAV